MADKLCDYVRGLVRDRYLGTNTAFDLAEVYAIADKSAARYPHHRNVKARHGVVRRMLQDERKHKGLVFAIPGVYKYYPLNLDTGKPVVYPSRMIPETSGRPPGARSPERDIARQRGERFYTPARPCKTCGGTKFYTSGASCRSCAIRGAGERQLAKKRAHGSRGAATTSKSKSVKRILERLPGELDSGYFDRLFKPHIRGKADGKRKSRSWR